MVGVVGLDNHVPSIFDTPLEKLTTPRSKSPGDACEKSPNARLERRSRQRDSDVSTADTTGSSRPSISSIPDIAEVQSPPSEVEDDGTPCSNLSQCSQEMMSTHTFAPPSLAPGANARQCSQVEWQLWWQSLAYEGACQKNLEQQQWLQQVEAQNNELTVLVAALRAEKRVLEQRPLGCEDV
ncbi:unnamed protein product [Symbiodinium natans]|uniref:Uncharacterized protein n=1 Tax=Symbiodinium natans TaxID=878477 RepID=A0A812V8H9_9DINO|nr:unnamed protein product [Symbiodinium natans]